MTVRKGGSPQAQVDATQYNYDLPAPTEIEEAPGTFANGDYYFAYALASKVKTGMIGCSTESVALTVTGAGAKGVTVRIWPVNSGEGIGKAATGADYPANGGYSVTEGTPGSGVDIYARTGADVLTKQTVASIVWDATNRCLAVHVNAYTNTGAVNPNTSLPVSGRGLFYHPDIPALIGWFGDRCRLLACGPYARPGGTPAAFTGETILTTDKDGNLFSFSRFPSRIYCAILNKLMVATDGIGRPKKLSLGAAPAFFLLGANKPATDPTAADSGVEGVLSGVYQYRVSYVHATTKADGTTYQAESDPSAQCVCASVTSKKINLTIPTTTETSILYYRVYRTATGGTQVYFLADVAAAAFSNPYVDNTADSGLTTTVFPVTDTELPHLPPPAGLWFIQEYRNRFWAVKCLLGYNATSKIIFDIIPSSVVAFSYANEPDWWPSTSTRDTGQGCITGLLNCRGVLYVFKESEIGVFEGSGESDDDFRYTTLYRGVGAVMHSPVVAYGDIYFIDPNQGPMRLSGYSVEQISRESLQVEWQADLLCGVRDAVFDSTHNQIRWIVTQYSCNYSTYTINPTIHKEYVLYFAPNGDLKSSAFCGTTIGSNVDRQMTAYAVAPVSLAVDVDKRRHGLFWVDTYGRWVLDDQVYYDSDPNTSATHGKIVWFCNLVWMFGDNPEMVKVFRHLYCMFRMGATITDGLVVYGAYLSSFDNNTPAYVLINTIAATAALAHKWRMIRCDIQAALQGNLSQERGLLIRLYGTTESGPARIAMVSNKMKYLDDLRNAP